jgi:hypothetical protein
MFALDTIGSYNPVTSWLSGAMSQIGFINITNMSSGDRDLEKSITREVAGYGRQLGRITEALQAVCSHLDYTNWGSDEQQAVKDFTGMAHDIQAHKRRRQPDTKEAIDQLITALRGLKEQDQVFYDQVLQRLRQDLLPGGAAALPPTSEHDRT